MRRLIRLVKPLVPRRIRAPLGAAWSALLRLRRYPSARPLLRGYAAHYRDARRVYRADGNAAEPAVASIRDVGVRVIVPGTAAGMVQLPDNYLNLLDRMRADVTVRIDAALAAASGDTPLAITVSHYLDIDGLEDLCAQVIPQIERRIFGAYAAVDKVYVYRSLVSDEELSLSWLWHFDEHPPELLKILIYLTEVDEGTGPFAYLASGKSSKALLGARMPIGGHSRISELRMAMYVERGYEIRQVTGPPGTMILFQDNVIHRATPAARGHRDVIVLQVRPSCLKDRPYIDARWTGSFQHVSVNEDPWTMAPRLEA